jgi:hypothetical protein
MSPRASRVPRVDIPAELRDFLDSLDRKIPNHNLTASGAPGVTDDGEHGYRLGSIWIDSPDVYMCVDTTAGAAVWTQIG